jgi:dihydroorotate dehydrogenase electron transfer subunit
MRGINLFVSDAVVEKSIELEHKVYLLKLHCPQIASIIKPGQFLNVKVNETLHPLLRRPFSVSEAEGDYLYIMFNVFGEGTQLLASKQKGEVVNLLGPLGNGFNLEGDFDTPIIVAGGLGAAPFPFLIQRLKNNQNPLCFIGGRTYRDVIKYRMKNILVATDDGSEGFKGTVIELLQNNINILKKGKVKLFACGPNAMLRALKEFAEKNKLECEASLESAMACGFGICQGCPIESAHNKDKYLLVCKDGPVFNIKDVII